MKKINCILLVDDNKADNMFHKIIIEEAGVCEHVKVSVNGEEALSYLKSSAEQPQPGSTPKPNIIYLDINMPRMDGFEFLMEYKRLPENIRSKVMIIVLTNSLNPDDKKLMDAVQEVSEFQNKPLTVERVKKTVEKYLKKFDEVFH